MKEGQWNKKIGLYYKASMDLHVHRKLSQLTYQLLNMLYFEKTQKLKILTEG